MLKQLLAFLLLVSLGIQVLSKSLVVLEYTFNKAAFAKNCENKKRPQLKCGGKCQMMKKLKAEEEKEKQFPEFKADGKEVVVSSKSFYFVPDFTAAFAQLFFSFPPDKKPVHRPRTLFHPPGQA